MQRWLQILMQQGYWTHSHAYPTAPKDGLNKAVLTIFQACKQHAYWALFPEEGLFQTSPSLCRIRAHQNNRQSVFQPCRADARVGAYTRQSAGRHCCRMARVEVMTARLRLSRLTAKRRCATQRIRQRPSLSTSSSRSRGRVCPSKTATGERSVRGWRKSTRTSNWYCRLRVRTCRVPGQSGK